MGLRNDLVAISHEVTTQVIIARGGVVVHERTALDGDGAGVTIVLVEHIVFSTIAVIGVEEATLDNDVAIVAFDDRVAITIGIAANSEGAAQNSHGCAVLNMDALIVSAFTAVKGSVFNRDISIGTIGLYCNGTGGGGSDMW